MSQVSARAYVRILAIVGLVLPVFLVERCVTVLAQIEGFGGWSVIDLSFPDGYIMWMVLWWLPFLVLALLSRWALSLPEQSKAAASIISGTVLTTLTVFMFTVGMQIDAWKLVWSGRGANAPIMLMFGPIVVFFWMVVSFVVGAAVGWVYLHLRRLSIRFMAAELTQRKG